MPEPGDLTRREVARSHRWTIAWIIAASFIAVVVLVGGTIAITLATVRESSPPVPPAAVATTSPSPRPATPTPDVTVPEPPPARPTADPIAPPIAEPEAPVIQVPEAPPVPAAPPPVECPTGGLDIRIGNVSTTPTDNPELWRYTASGTITNGYSHAIEVSDTPRRLLIGVDDSNHEVYSFNFGTYSRGGGGTGFIALQPGETLGFQFDEPRVPYDPATIANWAPNPVPETLMLAQWLGDWEAITRTCGNPGGWHF